jgi:hypothetical membrane protein
MTFFRQRPETFDPGLAGYATAQRASPSVSGWLLACAAAIPILTIGSWLIADALQPIGYSPLRQSVSVLAGHAGNHPWIVTGALIGAGACYLLLAQALTAIEMTARIGLVVAGLSAIGIAVCPEPLHGSTPQHLAFTALGGLTIAVWPAIVARSAMPMLTPRVSAISFGVCSGLGIWTFIETRTDDALGLAERLSSSTAICWPLVVVFALYRASSHRLVVSHPAADLGTGDRAYSRTSSCQSSG